VTNWLCKLILVAQLQEAKTGCKVVETSMEGCGSKEGSFAKDDEKEEISFFLLIYTYVSGSRRVLLV
jgi:hypothetical protein